MVLGKSNNLRCVNEPCTEADGKCVTTAHLRMLLEHSVHRQRNGCSGRVTRGFDVARDDMRDGEGSAYSFARTVKIFHELLAAYREGREVDTGDSIDALLREISGPPVRD